MTMLTLSVIVAVPSGVLAFWRRPQLPRFWLLLVIAMVPQVGNLAGISIPGMFFVAIAVIGIWCAYNHDIPGTAVVAVGIGLNLLVMGFHGGAMPIRADILHSSFGVVAAPGTILVGSKDVVIDTSALWLLSDWIILALGAKKVVVSPGDLIIVAGVAWWLLFSHQPEKDQAHADIIDQTSLARTAYTPAPWAE